MARAHYVRYITDEEGRPIPGVSVTVRDESTTNNIAATIYSVDVGATTLTNPFIGAANGKVEFFLDSPARVDLYITKTGYDPQTITADVILLTASSEVKQDELVNLTQRTKLNFTGDSVAATDAGAVADRIDVTINHLGTAVHSAAQPAQTHAIGGATHSGTLAHSATSGQTIDDHHAKSHVHLADSSGTVAHSSTSGQTATDHHPAPAAGPDADDTIDVAGAAGTASTFARSGHGHKVSTSAATPTRIQATASAAAGATGAIARQGHIHRGTVEATDTANNGPVNTLVETSLLDAVYTIAAGTVVVGQTYRVRVKAFVTSTGSPTLTIKAKLGATVVRTVALLCSGVDAYADIEFELRFAAPGAAAQTRSTLRNFGINIPSGADASTTGVAVDTTVSQNLDITATWSAASASNSCKSVTATVEILEP